MLRTAAALLSYPEVDDRAEVAAAAPPELRAWAERWAAADLQAVRRDYVSTFDFSAARALELTYRRYGDERERGKALVELKRRYREAGFEIEPGVLPDHLPLVLELCAAAPEAGQAILDEYRPELEGLRLALHESDSPWAEVLDVLTDASPYNSLTVSGTVSLTVSDTEEAGA